MVSGIAQSASWKLEAPRLGPRLRQTLFGRHHTGMAGWLIRDKLTSCFFTLGQGPERHQLSGFPPFPLVEPPKVAFVSMETTGTMQLLKGKQERNGDKQLAAEPMVNPKKSKWICVSIQALSRRHGTAMAWRNQNALDVANQWIQPWILKAYQKKQGEEQVKSTTAASKPLLDQLADCLENRFVQ